MHTACSSSRPGGGLHQAPPPGADPPPGAGIPTRHRTHACENIALLQTSFAGGNNSLALPLLGVGALSPGQSRIRHWA